VAVLPKQVHLPCSPGIIGAMQHNKLPLLLRRLVYTRTTRTQEPAGLSAAAMAL
jgi:hypothetical protein